MSARPLQGYVPPPYPYDRLDKFKPLADAFEGGVVDLSIGTPCDPPTEQVIAALASSNAERGYPPSIGTTDLRSAIRRWMNRRFSIDMPLSDIAACVGTKEFVATTPHWMRMRDPRRDTVLYPAIAYPTYQMGAVFAGCRAVAVPLTSRGGLDLAAIDPGDADRAVMLWANSPSNPTGALDDLTSIAEWGRIHDVPVFSDECYVEFTWDSAPRSMLQSGPEGVVAVHSLSKRSNLAGLRVGFYGGDHDIVDYLKEMRKHAGLLVPGPVQSAAVAALDDDRHVAEQRDRYMRRLRRTAGILSAWSGIPFPLPAGGFYLWAAVADAWNFTEQLASEGGALVSPGEFYGDSSVHFVRVAVVQPDDRLELVAKRLGVL